MAAKKAAKKRTAKRASKKIRVPVPSVGRIVHYHSDTNTPYVGIITVGNHADPRGPISLMILSDGGSTRAAGVPFSKEPKPGHWGWPPRVEDVEIDE